MTVLCQLTCKLPIGWLKAMTRRDMEVDEESVKSEQLARGKPADSEFFYLAFL